MSATHKCQVRLDFARQEKNALFSPCHFTVQICDELMDLLLFTFIKQYIKIYGVY
jgi:hypothetical protein